MIELLLLPVAMSALLAAAAPALSRRLPPQPGAVGLATAAGVVALCTTWSLSLVAVSLVDDLPDTPLLEAIPVPDAASVAGAGVLCWCACRVGVLVVRRRRLRRALDAIVAHASGELVVVADPRPDAFAYAGRPGRIVVTAAMLRALSAPQRRALLAHERAHLHGRHSVLLVAAQFAAAANPLLVPVRCAVEYLCERNADEAAAADVGGREVVAEALAAAAFAGVRRGVALAFHRLGVADRVAVLLAPPRRYTSAGLLTAGMIALVAVIAAGDATDRFYEIVRAAMLS